MEKNWFERYGLTGNPFRELTSESLEDVNLYHATQNIDEELYLLWQEALDKENKATIVIVGDTGMGKTQRLLLMQSEAKKVGAFSVFVNILPTDRMSSAKIVDSILENTKKRFFLSPPWLREMIKIKKIISKEYDSDRVAKAIANVLNSNVTSLLLINDLGNSSKSEDFDCFIQMLQRLSDNLQPGVLLLIGSENRFMFDVVKKFPSFKDRINRIITIPKLNDKEACLLISKRLLARRVVEDLDPLYPFDEEIIAIMNKDAEGVPRRLLQIADRVIEFAAKKRQIRIDNQLLRSVIGQKKIDSFLASDYPMQNAKIMNDSLRHPGFSIIGDTDRVIEQIESKNEKNNRCKSCEAITMNYSEDKSKYYCSSYNKYAKDIEENGIIKCEEHDTNGQRSESVKKIYRIMKKKLRRNQGPTV